MKIPVDSIEIPVEFVTLASEWYDGSGCMLYAVASTGGLTTGTIRPIAHESDGTGYPMSDEQWYYSLWVDLAADVGYAVRAACKGCTDQFPFDEDDEEYEEKVRERAELYCAWDGLKDFEDFADGVVEQLAENYGLEDWEG